MEISKGAAGVLAGLCLAAGAGGAWLATGRSSSEAPMSGTAIAGAPAPGADLAPTVPEAQPVEQSEGVISESAKTPAAPAPSPEARERRVVTAPRAAASRPARSAAETSQRTPPAPATVERELVRDTRPSAIEANAPARDLETSADPEPQRSAFEELVVTADSVIGLQVESAVSSERATVEDEVTARVTRDVRVGDRVAIPAGARATGEVTLVERGGRMRERARLGVRFTSIVLADGTRIPIETDAIIREGDPPGGESAAKIGGGAIGGAILGGILGGARGAAIGGAAGAGAGTAAVIAGGRNPASLPAGTAVTVRLLKPASVTVDK